MYLVCHDMMYDALAHPQALLLAVYLVGRVMDAARDGRSGERAEEEVTAWLGKVLSG